MTKSSLQEKLVMLYLRLNGYATTGLILHSPDDNSVEGEIDVIAIRFANHTQPDRIIQCSGALEIPNDTYIDIIIGEVKGGKNPLQFNESLRVYPNRAKKIIQWIGIAPEQQVDILAKQLMDAVQHTEVQHLGPIPRILYKDISIRPLIFAPDKTSQRKNQIKFINGPELINFCWKCFRPENRRETCETNYKSVNNWGEQFERLVGYFKDHNKQNAGNINELYVHFNIK